MIVAEIPPDWEVPREVGDAMIDFLLQRRHWLAAGFVTSIFLKTSFSKPTPP